MHPILWDFGIFQIHSYGVLVSLGFLLGTLWIAQRAGLKNYSSDQFITLTCVIVLVGFIGARLLHVVYFPELYQDHIWGIFFDRGGLVWYGGFVSAGAMLWLMTRIYRVSILESLDIFIVPTALGLAFGRIGCFLAGCCYGSPTTIAWHVQYPIGHSSYPQWVHPTQLYESFLVLALMVLCQYLWKRYADKVPGLTFAAFLVGYGLIRFFTESLRGDRLMVAQTLLSVSQWISLGALAIGLLGIGWLSYTKPCKTRMKSL